jgi:hypothetical protein
MPEGKDEDEKLIIHQKLKPITSFIVEMSWPGIEIVQRCQFEGCHGIEDAHIRCTNVQIPVENVLG